MNTPVNTAAAARLGASPSLRMAVTTRLAEDRNRWSHPIIIAGPVSGRHHRQLPHRYHHAVHRDLAFDASHLSGLGEPGGDDAQLLPGQYGVQKLEAVHGSQQRRGAGFRPSPSAQHDSRGLRHGFDQKDARQNRPPRKMSRERRFLRVDPLHRGAAYARRKFLHPVDPQKRRPVRNYLFNLGSLHHLGLYTSNVPSGILVFNDVISIRNTLVTPLLPSTSSERSRNFVASSLTTIWAILRRKLSVRGTIFITYNPGSRLTAISKFFFRFPSELSRLKYACVRRTLPPTSMTSVLRPPSVVTFR